jgi:hypothetical protein
MKKIPTLRILTIGLFLIFCELGCSKGILNGSTILNSILSAYELQFNQLVAYTVVALNSTVTFYVNVKNASQNIVTTGSYTIYLSAFTDSACSTPISGTNSGCPSGCVDYKTSSNGVATFQEYAGNSGSYYLQASSSGLTSTPCSGPIIFWKRSF